MACSVTLKNIRQKDNVITADYYPNMDPTDIGHIKYFVDSDTSHIKYCKKDQSTNDKIYSIKSMEKIKAFRDRDFIPEIGFVHWC